MTGVRVRFCKPDPYALWDEGDLAEDLGPESPGAPMIRLFRMERTGEVIALTSPYARGIVQPAWWWGE